MTFPSRFLFSFFICEPGCSMKRPLGREFHSGDCSGHPLPPQASASDKSPGTWECHWWMTAALAAAAAGATMASSSSGLTAARFLSRSFLRKSGRDSLFQAPRAPGPAGPRVLVQAAAGPSGQDLGGGLGAARVRRQVGDPLGWRQLCWIRGAEA